VDCDPSLMPVLMARLRRNRRRHSAAVTIARRSFAAIVPTYRKSIKWAIVPLKMGRTAMRRRKFVKMAAATVAWPVAPRAQ
jgi:hypothetical protein